MDSSLNMNNLARSLPSSALVMAEQETMDRFKAAAQALTLLYRSSTQASKRHFDAGYAAALDDLLNVIQHGLSVGPDANQSLEGVEEGMTIGRVMDWIEARQEGLRVASSSGECEEEEDERGTGAAPRAGPSHSHLKNGTGRSGAGENERNVRSTQTARSTSPPPSSAAAECSDGPPKVLRPSRSPPPSSPITSSSAPCHPVSSVARPHTRARHRLSQAQPLHTSSATNTNFANPPSSASSLSYPSVLGAKRRHAAMLFDTYPPPSPAVALPPSELDLASPQHSQSATPENFQFTLGPAGIPGLNSGSGARRRVRSLRSNNALRAEGLSAAGEQHAFSHNGHLASPSIDTVMEFDDEGGRERKRLARR